MSRATEKFWRKRLGRATRRLWAILRFAVDKYFQIDGLQWAAAFAFNGLFSLFPLMVLFLTIASSFVSPERAGKEVLVYLGGYAPINGEMQRRILDTIASVINARGRAGVVAFLILVWSALQCFSTLIQATNRAWGAEVHKWWRLPLKSLVLLGITAAAGLLGMAVPVVMGMRTSWLFPVHDLRSLIYGPGSVVIPLVVVFLGLSLFYWLAPRRTTRFAEVWAAALFATVLLRAGERVFVIYLKNFSRLNAVYGAFGGFMALLLWVYISGCIVIFGACLCAGQSEMRPPVDPTRARSKLGPTSTKHGDPNGNRDSL